ncbi:hypothetical protein HW555_009523 [Spodoptera exigua]|uniref:Uncharacterized protein n=1 Tax=Spodoptera exigua TaxID=7107 RepID=A0A835GCW8_SPOEX|nr:hypothetical protein HW555_009523 [Spodoptera exigua]
MHVRVHYWSSKPAARTLILLSRWGSCSRSIMSGRWGRMQSTAPAATSRASVPPLASSPPASWGGSTSRQPFDRFYRNIYLSTLTLQNELYQYKQVIIRYGGFGPQRLHELVHQDPADQQLVSVPTEYPRTKHQAIFGNALNSSFLEANPVAPLHLFFFVSLLILRAVMMDPSRILSLTLYAKAHHINETYIDRQGLLRVEMFHYQLKRPTRVQLIEVHERLRNALEEHLPLFLCYKLIFNGTIIYDVCRTPSSHLKSYGINIRTRRALQEDLQEDVVGRELVQHAAQELVRHEHRAARQPSVGLRLPRVVAQLYHPA